MKEINVLEFDGNGAMPLSNLDFVRAAGRLGRSNALI